MQKFLISILLTIFLGGCSAYKVDIQQGNYLDEELIGKLETGMNRRQVRFLLGTPTISDPFHPDRWDYLFEKWVGGELQVRRHVTLHFNGDTLARVDPH